MSEDKDSTSTVEVRQIPGRRGYFADDRGRILSQWRLHGGSKPKLEDFLRPLRASTVKGGYLRVVLGRQGNRNREYVHVLVLTTFHGPKPPGMETRHLNGNPADNRPENLVWGTKSDNEKDKTRHGTWRLRAWGEKSGSAKLTESNVREIRRMAASGLCQRVIGEQFGVAQSTVSNAIHARNWKHV
jgi:hypothetical protein